MNLSFNTIETEGYKSPTQIIRRISEAWVNENMYCPRCGNEKLEQFSNNQPVADFYCLHCQNQFELKSKNGKFGGSINDGAYQSMISRITSNTNPDFLFLSYSKDELKVISLLLIPKHFFVPEIIEKRKPLLRTARRAGWIGCNIILNQIPTQGRIQIINDGIIEKKELVISQVNRIKSLQTNDINARGWLFDVLNCVNSFSPEIFSLSDIYSFENSLNQKHPDNNNVKAKIRQQLQFLRDKGFIEFLGGGQYRKIG
jgi:type II restriction enzyme